MNTVPHLLATFSPTHYDLSLAINRKDRTFSGTVSVVGSLIKQADYIPFHTQDLTIKNVTIDGKAGVFTLEEDGELRVNLNSTQLQPGEHITVITFEGAITDAMHGMYPSYFEHDGIKKELLATQFESHHAREVFPCIDEPAAKATFNVTLSTELDVTVLGNMPIDWQREENNMLVTAFQTTPRMSTYLLAWVVGELHKKSATTKSGVEVNVWATPAQRTESLDFALDIATRTIDFYDEYFGTPYPLPKADHVALPDFSSGAMENWGLITYREIALLADPATTGISSRQYIATVIAHELAHQWFGNLVTMKWWDNLWLNESFATLMEYIAVDALHPEWNIWLEFSTNESIMALRRDAIDGVQSVQVDVSHPDEISTLFDGAIVYAKGARLLRMLQHYVGNTAFRAGLTQYFASFAYDNTEGDDLWKAIGDASGKDIASMMNTWISQPGYPVVSVKQDGTTVTLTQSQFYIGPHQPSHALWPIPLESTCGEMPSLLTEHASEVTRHHTSTLRFNSGDTAHFITHYSPALFAKLLEDLEEGNLSEIDRIQLLNETTLLIRGGLIGSAELIPLITAFKDETSEPVWGMISLALSELRKFVEDDPEAEASLRELSRTIAQKQYQRLGWNEDDGESEEDAKLRAIIIGLTLYGEDAEAITMARHLYDTTQIESLNPELRPLIISSVVRYGDNQIVTALLELYRSTQNAELAQDICVGITSTRIPEEISRLLDAMKDASVIRPQDVARWFVYFVRGRDSRTQAWQWIQHNWQWIEDTFSGDKSYDDYPRYAATGLSTPKQLAEYITFFTPKQVIPALSRVISLGITEIEGRVALIERDKRAVITALKQR